MAKTKQAGKSPVARVLDLETWQRLRSSPEFASKEGPLWSPSPCFSCSNLYKRQATGKSVVDPSVPCPYCNGSGYGPQYRAYISRADEILMGGAKGGGKSNSAAAHLFKGNTHLPHYKHDGTPLLTNQSYLYSPYYVGLILRRNAVDLRAFVADISKYMEAFGGVWVGGDQNMFRFESGAVIYTGHVENEESYQKYLGFPDLHRVDVEEVTLIEHEETYLLIISSVRSTHTHDEQPLIPQVFCSANPTGPGKNWVRNRFVTVRKKDGTLYAPNELIVEEVRNPITGKVGQRTRVFIPAFLRDNPFLTRDESYALNLASLPELQRRIFLDGDWTIDQGSYFNEFRDPSRMTLPLPGEPSHACHVVKKNFDSRAVVDPFDQLSIGLDWGFTHETAAYWGARKPNGQVHVIQEMVTNQTTAEEIGSRVAAMSVDLLNQSKSHKITMFLSPDAFVRRSNDVGIASFAELIAYGVSQVIGPRAVSLPTIDLAQFSGEDLSGSELRRGWRSFYEAVQQRKSIGIEIRPANNNRVFGWQWIKTLLRWDPPVRPSGEFSQETYDRLYRDLGRTAAERYKESFSRELLEYPRLLIWDSCPRLLEAIPYAQCDDRNPEDVSKTHFRGADSLDAWRYLIVGTQSPPPEPTPEERVEMEMSRALAGDPSMSRHQAYEMRQHLIHEAREADTEERGDPFGSGRLSSIRLGLSHLS